jgi:GNAT superfamily N-acetyltransferase
MIVLCREHASYERLEYHECGQHLRLAQALFGEPALVHGWIAEVANEPIGYMTATVDYATWDARPFVHMDCLFLREAFRRGGIGKRLIAALLDFARERRCVLIQWQTPIDNDVGISFYERIGAYSLDKKRFFLKCST